MKALARTPRSADVCPQGRPPATVHSNDGDSQGAVVGTRELASTAPADLVNHSDAHDGARKSLEPEQLTDADKRFLDFLVETTMASCRK
jgi:hypothetical protein